MGSPSDHHPKALNYATPSEPSRFATRARAASLRVALPVALCFAAFAVPHPEGIWYLGRNPQWLVAIDVQGLEIGPSSGPACLGWIPLVVLKMLAVGVSYWLIRHWLQTRRRGTAAS
ncbi:MAG: hypothetical protein ACFCVE_13130 [Phycisphaerae bacterium]